MPRIATLPLRLFVLLFATTVLLASAPAHSQHLAPVDFDTQAEIDDAQLEEDAEEKADDLRESDLFGWAAPSPQDQLAADDTRFPPERGALFVPYLANPADEPEFVVYIGRTRVTSGQPGSRVVLAPGDYTVQLGGGTAPDIRVPFEIVGGETTVLPVTWGGLRVEVVDERGVPHRSGYELIRVTDRDLFGFGYGADLLSGERLQTWVLPSDLYRLVPPGSSYRARTDYSTVFVPAGGFVRYRLVIDPDTGQFLGAGVITPEESGTQNGNENLTTSLVLGVNGNLSVQRDTAASGEIFIDSSNTWRDGPHQFVGVGQVEEGIRWINPEVGDALPLQKSDDRVRVDLLYSYDITPVFGPYARAGTEFSIFPDRATTTEEVSVTYRRADSSTATRIVEAGDAFRTVGYFGRTQFFEGVGVNAWAVRGTHGELKLSAGLGFRQWLYRDFFALNETSTGTTRIYDEVENSVQQGFEALAIGRLRVGSVLRFTSNLEVFSDFRTLGDPTISWENTTSLRLFEMLSLDYVFDLDRDPAISNELDLKHEVLLRFSWQIL